MAGLFEIGKDEGHLWFLDFRALPKALPDDEQSPLFTRYLDLLTPEESLRHRAFYFPKGRIEFLLTRALVRTTLSRYASVDPRDWRFSQNQHGRPEISHPQCDLPLRFNLSNTDGLIACLVTLSLDAGVDVESLNRPGETVSSASSHFAESETSALWALPKDQQRYRFFEYWTLKEAYIKARGMGLAIPLDQFWFDVASRPISIGFDPRLGDDPHDWQFDQFRPTPEHLVATAIRRGGSAQPIRISAKSESPLPEWPGPVGSP